MREMCVNFLRFSSGQRDCPAGDVIFIAVNRTAVHPLGRSIGALGGAVYKPFSRGSVELDPADASAPPRILFNALTDPRDMSRIMQVLGLCGRVLTHPHMRAVWTEAFFPDAAAAARLSRPGLAPLLMSGLADLAFDFAPPLRRRMLTGNSIDMGLLVEDATALRRFAIEQTSVAGHVAGTCRMGRADDPDAVLDPRCNVIGVPGLRVVDASAMPDVVSANTNIPVQMLAEKAAAMIFDDRKRV